MNWLSKLKPSGFDGDEWSKAFVAMVVALHKAQHLSQDNLVLVAASAMRAESNKRALEEVPVKLVRRYLTDARRMSKRNVNDIVASWRRYSTQ